MLFNQIKNSKIACVSIIISFCTPCYAWNTLGHMIIANIAYSRLNPEVKNTIDILVDDFSKEYPSIKTFIQLAPWPDSLHSQKIENFSRWHYIDLAFSQDGTPLHNLSATDNVIWSINTIYPIIKNKQTNVYERARFLAFLVHLIGDIHQPLHTTAKISSAYPDGDKGGNLFIIYYPTESNSTNLHAFWDKGLTLLVGSTSQENISTLTTMITKAYPEDFFSHTMIIDSDPTDWAQEGFNSCTQFVYNTPEYQVPSLQYVTNGTQLSEKEIALAGYRLASVLNTLLSE